jgi:uncharacterized protein
MPYGIKNKSYSFIISTLKANPNIDEAILFGSRAKGNFKTGSDVDIALKGEEISMSDINELLNRFDEINMAYTIDLVIYKNIQDPLLLEHINRVGIEIYKNETLRTSS